MKINFDGHSQSFLICDSVVTDTLLAGVDKSIYEDYIRPKIQPYGIEYLLQFSQLICGVHLIDFINQVNFMNEDKGELKESAHHQWDEEAEPVRIINLNDYQKSAGLDNYRAEENKQIQQFDNTLKQSNR